MMRRILVLATVALVTAAMMVAMAMPALAAKPAPTLPIIRGSLGPDQH